MDAFVFSSGVILTSEFPDGILGTASEADRFEISAAEALNEPDHRHRFELHRDVEEDGVLDAD